MINERKRSARIIILLALAFFLCAVVSCFFGRYHVPPGQVVAILLSRIFPVKGSWNVFMETAVLNVRLPRVLLSGMVGASLSCSGAAYQAVFNNPMASPDLLGASSGAAFGAALAILLGVSSALVTASAFAFGLLSIAVVFAAAKFASGKNITNLILAGIMISSLFSAGTSFIKLVADPNSQLPAITYWLMGSLSDVKWPVLLLAAAPMLIGALPLIFLRWRMNLLTLGDGEARTLGVNAKHLRVIIVCCATLMTAASVAVSGMIGWVGLVVPHLCRRVSGNDCRTLIPASMLGGALFMLIVDDISRCLLLTEIPIGILTAFVGAPFFVFLVMRKGWRV